MSDRGGKWNRLVELLDEADALQQELIADEVLCYDWHCQIQNLADEITDRANAEGVDIG